MNDLFVGPSLDDLIRLLRAWRFWVLGGLLGALLGAVMYAILPPRHFARATVNVDFNLEQAWPQETDRQHFYYLERETRKLEEIAWSDRIMDQLSLEFKIPPSELRGEVLQLSQPAEAGWHFYAEHEDPQIAGALASAWAEAFTLRVQEQIESGGVNEFVRVETTQSAHLPTERRIPLGNYLLAGSMGLLTLAAFVVLFMNPRKFR